MVFYILHSILFNNKTTHDLIIKVVFHVICINLFIHFAKQSTYNIYSFRETDWYVFYALPYDFFYSSSVLLHVLDI